MSNGMNVKKLSKPQYVIGKELHFRYDIPLHNLRVEMNFYILILKTTGYYKPQYKSR